jgi:hypothetical protein
MLNYQYRACQAGIKEKMVEMAINGSGIRDTARVLKINKNIVIYTLKKSRYLSAGSSQAHGTHRKHCRKTMPIIQFVGVILNGHLPNRLHPITAPPCLPVATIKVNRRYGNGDFGNIGFVMTKITVIM